MNYNYLKSLLFGLIALTVFACSDDDEAAPDPLQGTWVLKSNVLDCADDSRDFNINFTCDDENCIKITYSGGTATISVITNGVENTDSFSYNLSGNTVSNVDGERLSFEILGDDLILTQELEDGCVNTIRYFKES